MSKKHEFVLVLKTPPNFMCRCITCKGILDSLRDVIWADLKGEAFKAYYCNNCKNLIEENKK